MEIKTNNNQTLTSLEAYRVYKIILTYTFETKGSRFICEVVDRYNEIYRDPLPRNTRPREITIKQVMSLLRHIRDKKLRLEDFRD